jgi:Glyoxalase-like domain
MTLTLYAVAIDCHDASTLAQFWAAALGGNVDDGATAEFASIGLQDPAHNRPQWMFNQVPESKKAKNRVHVDLLSPNLDEEVERLISLEPPGSTISRNQVPPGPRSPTRKVTSSTLLPTLPDAPVREKARWVCRPYPPGPIRL